MTSLEKKRIYDAEESYALTNCHICNDDYYRERKESEHILEIDPETEEVLEDRVDIKTIVEKSECCRIKMIPSNRLVILEICEDCCKKLGYEIGGGRVFNCPSFVERWNRCRILLDLGKTHDFDGEIEPECLQCLIHRHRVILKTEDSTIFYAPLTGFGGIPNLRKGN